MSPRTDRARRLLLDRGGWIEATSSGVYALRILPDRRARVVLRLDEGEFLNDSLMDFYLRYLYEGLPEHIKPRVHIFSTFFYARLRGYAK